MSENVSPNSDKDVSEGNADTAIDTNHAVQAEMSPKTRQLRLLALIGYFGLFIWVALWHFVLADNTEYSRLFLVLFWIIPLLFPLRGIVRGNPYTHAWANFIVMIYFLHGLTAIYTEQKWWYALIEIIFATMMFIGCSYYARARGRELGLKLKKLSELQ